MDQSHVPPPAVREVLRSFQDHRRLIDLVHIMAREMERLDEDNRQLRAAVGIYREVARRGGLLPTIPMPPPGSGTPHVHSRRSSGAGHKSSD